MYCMAFVTVRKIKISHKGALLTNGNFIKKTKIVFLLQISWLNKNLHISCNTYTNLEYIKL